MDGRLEISEKLRLPTGGNSFLIVEVSKIDNSSFAAKELDMLYIEHIIPIPDIDIQLTNNNGIINLSGKHDKVNLIIIGW